MTCECCHCCFCCCQQNYDANPNLPKKPKTESPIPPVVPSPAPPVGSRNTPIAKPPVVTNTDIPTPISVDWPDDLIPGPPTVEDWIENPDFGATEEDEDFSFPPKTPEEPPPPVLGCMDPLATNYNPLATQNDGSCVYPPPPCPVYTLYTPNTWNKQQSPFNTLPYRMDNGTTLSQTVNADQGPPTWVTQPMWDSMIWDGVPLADPYNKTPSQLCAWMFNGRAMKGLRQHYETFKPFCDPTRPTIAEIDNWHLEVIKHFRRLLGVTTDIQLDERLFLEATWAEERYHTTYWNTNYPGTNGTAYGPCVSQGNQHCGSSFIPSLEDQQPYYTNQFPSLAPTMMQTSRAEAVGGQNTDLPWMLKLVGALQNWVCSEGLVGHTGPFVTRTKVGMVFFAASGGSSSFTRIRIKWS